MKDRPGITAKKTDEDGYCQPFLMSWRDYKDCLIACGKTAKEAEAIARKLYTKQYGMAPEEHNAKLYSGPSDMLFFDVKIRV